MNRWSRLAVSGVVAAATVAAAGAVSAASPLPNLAAPTAAPAAAPSLLTQPDNVFVPIPACRLVNTHKARGKIRKHSPRNFTVVGNGNLADQGGNHAGCGVPSGASAVSLVLTALTVSKSGQFTAFPRGTSSGLGTLAYTKKRISSTGATEQITPGFDKGLTVSSTGKANLTIDVNGYYSPRIAASVSSNGTLGNHSSQVVSAARNAGNPTGVYVVTFNQDVSNCVGQVTPATTGYVLATVVLSDSTATVVGRNPNSGALSDTPTALTVTC
jgi:hypothetical protein